MLLRIGMGDDDRVRRGPRAEHLRRSVALGGAACRRVTLLSFLNTTKYPPSLVVPADDAWAGVIGVGWLDRRELSRTNPLIVFGRVPLFYFVLHFFLAHAVAVVMAVVTYGSAAWSFMFQPVPSMGGPLKSFPANFGYDLWVTYVMWVLVVMALYPLCRWFAAVKERRREWWLRYL